MDRKTAFILNLAKYAAYVAVLWIAVSHRGLVLSGSLFSFFLVFTIDSIRTYYLEEKLPFLSVSSLYLQVLLVFTFVFLEGSPLGGILLVILIAESYLTYSRPHGDYIFFISVTGYPIIGAASLYWRAELDWNNMLSFLINCLFFFFAYAFSYMARRQLDEKERAEEALEKLDRSRADLEEAYHKLVEISKEREQFAASEERSRLARELHDTLAHTLTAIIVSLEAGKKLLEKEPEKALAEIVKSQEQARKGLGEVRDTVKVLRSQDPEEIDFITAVKGLARDYSGSGIRIIYEHDEALELLPSIETNLFRIIQESITNSVRHGESKLIKVRLQRNESGLLLEIEDDGRGCSELVEGHGLRGIRERAAELGGEVSFENRKEQGFLVSLTLKELP